MELLRPGVVPDDRTLFIGRGDLPAPGDSATQALPETRDLTVELSCRGIGVFRLDVQTDPVAPGLLTSPTVTCSPTGDGAAATSALGSVPGGTELRLTYGGDATGLYLVHLRTDRPL